MKRTFFLIVNAIIVLFAMNSCKANDPDLDNSMNVINPTLVDQKQTIDLNGIDLVTKMNGMKDTRAMIVLQHFSDDLNSTSAFVIPFHQMHINLLNRNIKSMEIFEELIRDAIAAGGNLWGVYTWNPMLMKFDFVPVTTYMATFFFPADLTSTSNNATLTIKYAKSNVVVPNMNPVQYLPESLNILLTVDAMQALKYDFSGAYLADGTPTSLTEHLVFDKYNWNAALLNNSKDISVKMALKMGTETLIKVEMSASGSFTLAEITASPGPQYLINSGGLYFQIRNIAFMGGIKNFNVLALEMLLLKNTHDRSYADKQAAIINKYIKMHGYYVDTNQKFADVEFYVVENSFSMWDNVTKSYVKTTQYNFQPRLVLSDGTIIDAQSYMQNGFTDLIKMMNMFHSLK